MFSFSAFPLQLEGRTTPRPVLWQDPQAAAVVQCPHNVLLQSFDAAVLCLWGEVSMHLVELCSSNHAGSSACMIDCLRALNSHTKP